jgi:hypothetical protein
MNPVDRDGRSIYPGTVVENPNTGLQLRVVSLIGNVAEAEWISGPCREVSSKIEFGWRPNRCGWVTVK